MHCAPRVSMVLLTLRGCRQSAPWGTHVVAVANHKCRLPALCLASPLQGKLDLNLPALFLEVATFLSRCKKSFLCQPSWLWGAHLFLPAGWRRLSRCARRRAGRHPGVGGDCGAFGHGTSAPTCPCSRSERLRRSRPPVGGQVREGRDGECVPRRSHCIVHEKVREGPGHRGGRRWEAVSGWARGLPGKCRAAGWAEPHFAPVSEEAACLRGAT